MSGPDQESPQEISRESAPQIIRQSFRVQLRRNFATGLAITLPVAAAILVVYWLASSVDAVLPASWRPRVAGQPLPGMGIVFVLVLVLGVGALARNILGKQMIGFGERLMRRVPVLGATYDVFKQATDAVVRPEGPAYERAVLVEFPRKGMYTIAFVTGTAPAKARARLGEDFASVFIPTTPNPTSGYYALVRREELIEIGMGPQEALRLILSAGMATERGKS